MKNFTKEMRSNSHVSHRKNLLKERPFEKLGYKLRKKIVMEEQEFKCIHCELDEWMGLRITLELDHIDGNTKNNHRDNLRCLCPNCHSLTETWKVGKSSRKKKRSDHEIIEAYKSSKSMNETLKKLGYNWGSVDTVKNALFKYKIIDKI